MAEPHLRNGHLAAALYDDGAHPVLPGGLRTEAVHPVPVLPVLAAVCLCVVREPETESSGQDGVWHRGYLPRQADPV